MILVVGLARAILAYRTSSSRNANGLRHLGAPGSCKRRETQISIPSGLAQQFPFACSQLRGATRYFSTGALEEGSGRL